MRVLILLITVLFLGNLWGQEIPQGQLVKSLDWEDIYKKNPTFSAFNGQLKVDYEKNAAGKIELRIERTLAQPGGMVDAYSGYALADFSPVDLEKLGTGSYAVLGEMRTDIIAPRCPLAMWSNYPSGTGQWFPALDSTGNRFSPKSTQAWQSFWFPFDTKTARPISLSVNVDLHSPGRVYFRNMRLVQYPDAPPTTAPPTAAAPEPPTLRPSQPSDASPTAISASRPSLAQIGEQVGQQEKNALKTIWFCLGVAATSLTLLVIGGFIFIYRRLRRRNNERELRRMASLDS